MFKNKNSKEKNDKKNVVEASKEKITDTPVKKEVKAVVNKEAIITSKDEACIKNAIKLSRGFKTDKIKEYNEEDKCEIVVVAYDKSNRDLLSLQFYNK